MTQPALPDEPLLAPALLVDEVPELPAEFEAVEELVPVAPPLDDDVPPRATHRPPTHWSVDAQSASPLQV